MGKLSSILLGTVSGAALALFLTSDKGKQVCSQAQDFLDDLREDPEYAREQVCEKLTEVKEQATDFVLKTKEQVPALIGIGPSFHNTIYGKRPRVFPHFIA